MNSSKGLEVPDKEVLTKVCPSSSSSNSTLFVSIQIVADIQTPEPDFIADYDPQQYKEEDEEN